MHTAPSPIIVNLWEIMFLFLCNFFLAVEVCEGRMLLDMFPVVLAHIDAVHASLCGGAVFASLLLPLPHATFQPLNCTENHVGFWLVMMSKCAWEDSGFLLHCCRVYSDLRIGCLGQHVPHGLHLDILMICFTKQEKFYSKCLFCLQKKKVILAQRCEFLQLDCATKVTCS